MILILLYHRALKGKYGNASEMLDKHFAYIANRYHTYFPGERPKKQGELQICLTFDDATADFYSFVYPLLRRYRLKAVLGVITGLTVEKATLSLAKRLTLPVQFSRPSEVFCTWEELKKMLTSNLIQIASHSHYHKNLKSALDYDEAMRLSKLSIQDHLQWTPSTFICPYGGWNKGMLESNIYPFVMRIGNAYNKQWSPLLYRMQADRLATPHQPFSFINKVIGVSNFYYNIIRNK